MNFNKKRYGILSFIVTAGLLAFLAAFFFADKGYFGQLFTNIKKPKIEENADPGKNSESDISMGKSEKDIIDETIEKMSQSFVASCFARDEYIINGLLSKDAAYIKSPDGSSFIRYTGGGQLIEGYMATDRRLADYRQRWCYTEGETAMAGVEITLEGNNKPVVWYLHYKKENGQWKLFMMENE